MELSRQRLQASLEETAHISCPRCSGTGFIRGTESTALHVLRIIQEEAMKENTGAVHAQVPVDVASFLLNEKRAEIQKLEARLKVNIVLVPNPHLETPHYKVQRLKHDELNADGARAVELRAGRAARGAQGPGRRGRSEARAPGAGGQGDHAGPAGAGGATQSLRPVPQPVPAPQPAPAAPAAPEPASFEPPVRRAVQGRAGAGPAPQLRAPASLSRSASAAATSGAGRSTAAARSPTRRPARRQRRDRSSSGGWRTPRRPAAARRAW